MKQIPLSSGYVAIVDDEDYETLMQYKWSACFNRAMMERTGEAVTIYAHGRKGGQMVSMHRLLLNALPGQWVDHKDRDGLNNTRSNIRICTPAMNAFNNPKRKSGSYTSQYKGVCRVKGNRKWKASIYVNGKAVSLGCFEDESDAGRAYDTAALAHAGEFAVLNFPANNAD